MDTPATKYAHAYLSARGIQVETALGAGANIYGRGSCPHDLFLTRLGFTSWGNTQLPDLVEESLWFSCLDAKGNTQSHFCRVFPPPKDKEGRPAKFLTPKNGIGYPFIPRTTWDVADKPSHPLCLTEGPIKALAVLQAGGLPIGVGGVWMATTIDKEDRTDLHPVLAENFQWKGRKVFLVFDADVSTNPSVRQALIRTWTVLHARGADVMILRWPIAEGKGVDDYLAAKAQGAVSPEALFAEMCNGAVSLPDTLRPVDYESVEMEIFRSRLSGALLEQACRLTARPLKVGSSTLLKEIQDERRKLAAGTPEPMPDVTPRPLSQILDSIIGVLKRYVLFLLPEEQPLILALWVIHTWLFKAFDYSPIIFVYAPAIRSGKTRVLEALKLVCRNVEQTEGASAAALVRIISDRYVPTFLLDELDTVYGRGKGNNPEGENLRRFLNAGFKRGATFLRCGWKDKEIIVERLLCFCPKVAAAISQCLPTSVLDRSIPIEIKRQGKEKRAEKMRDREAAVSVASLRDELAVLAADEELIQTLNKARPVMPDELNDRQQDICEPLLAIAEKIGGDWPEKARKALIKLCTEEAAQEDVRIRLLTDIKRIFDETGEQALFTQTLLGKLVDIADDAPWADWFEERIKKEKFQTAASKLARQLKHYKITPVTVWRKNEYGGDVSAKGYQRAQFKDVWKRYLPENPPTNSDSSRQAVRNSYNSLTTNWKQPDASAVSDPPLSTEPSGHKSLTEKEVTQVSDGWTAKMQEKEGENISSPESAQSDQLEEPEKRLGYMPLDQMMDEIRQHFPNAKVLPPDNPEPEPPPDLGPELPFNP
jgi:hypothetical protein